VVVVAAAAVAADTAVAEIAINSQISYGLRGPDLPGPAFFWLRHPAERGPGPGASESSLTRPRNRRCRRGCLGG